MSCVANRAAFPSVAAEQKEIAEPVAFTWISDPGTPIAGQRYCQIYFAEPAFMRPVGWHACEGIQPFVWENHDRVTGKWVPES